MSATATFLITTGLTSILFSNCLAGKQSSNPYDTCIVNYKVSEIPSGIKSAIKKTYKAKLSLANPDEKFRSTDLPARGKLRKLKYHGYCENKYFLYYEHGGYASHSHIMVLERNSSDRFIVINNFVSLKDLTVDEVRRLLRREIVVSVKMAITDVVRLSIISYMQINVKNEIVFLWCVSCILYRWINPAATNRLLRWSNE